MKNLLLNSTYKMAWEWSPQLTKANDKRRRWHYLRYV